MTKNKTWKDIAGMLGIGASSSAAYTLRKHYTKNLLAYECQFDRGGIDPQPIINQVEASSKKKGSKAVSVPSPGSSNSQDSFPAPGSGSASMDGYGGYGYPPGGNQDFNGPSQRPSSQTNAPSPHGGTAACRFYFVQLKLIGRTSMVRILLKLYKFFRVYYIVRNMMTVFRHTVDSVL